MPQPAHRSLQLPLQLSFVRCPLMPRGKGGKQRPVGQALQRGPNLAIVTGPLCSVLPPADESPQLGLVGEAGQGLLQGCSVVVAPVAGVPPGIEGAQEGGVGQLSQGLLQGRPVEALALAGGAPGTEHLQESAATLSLASFEDCIEQKLPKHSLLGLCVKEKLAHSCGRVYD